jgi:hypothetical protein
MRLSLGADCDPERSPRRLVKNPSHPRLLKKVQMQGGVTHPRWVPGEVRDVLGSYVAAPRKRANPPKADRWAFFSSLLPLHQGRGQSDLGPGERLGYRAVLLGALRLLLESGLIDAGDLGLRLELDLRDAEPLADRLQVDPCGRMDARRGEPRRRQPGGEGAAAMSSSGFVPLPDSNRDGKE